MSALLEAKDLRKQFGGFVALNGVSITVGAGERLGLIGPNGSGKSTLVNTLNGALRHDGGTITLSGKNIGSFSTHQRVRAGMARTFQLARLFRSMTVAENLKLAADYSGPYRPNGDKAFGDACDMLKAIGMGGKLGHDLGALTQVEMRKLELARAMATRPQVLFADEALAGLSDPEVDEVVDLLLALNERGVAVVMIEHIMRAVTRFSQRLVVLVAGRKIADGDPLAVLADPEVERVYLGE